MKSQQIKNTCAVSDVIGYSLILGIIIVAVGVMIVIAYPIQLKIQDTAFMEAESEALTMLDGRISMVALGATPSQVTRIDLNGGILNIENSSNNRLSVVVANETGYQVEIFNESIGLIEYKVNDNIIAFESGGLFRKYPFGDPVMMSPPEFYYNGETLTFPIIRINNSASAGGKGVINVYSASANPPRKIYPNETSSSHINPLIGKQIRIKLKSDYYKAWAKYIEERTEAVPLANDIDHEVLVAFNSKPSDLPAQLKVPIEIIGIDTTNSTPLNKFIFNLTGVDSSFHMLLRAPLEDSEVFVLEMKKTCGSGTSGMLTTISYNKNGANESWTECVPMIFNSTMTADLLNQSYTLLYDSGTPSVTWNSETYPYNRTFNTSACCKGPVPVDVILQHYIKLIEDDGSFYFYPGDKPGDPAWEKGFQNDGSTLELDYSIIPPTISYMHIIDHDVNIILY
ncbi:MAG TPA: hypothetical protein VIO11_04255 [Candidatus Methanoperedens sp.]